MVITSDGQQIDESPSQAAVESFIPYFSLDSQKTKYLSYRATGFTVRESAQLAGIGKKWPERQIRRWRANDPLFAYWDGEGIVELQKQAGAHFTFAEFTRNFRLAMEKDAKVLHKSMLEGEEGEDGNIVYLTKEEHEYLLKIRPLYSPQALEAITKVLKSGGEDGKKWNFTEAVVELSSGGTVTFRQGEVSA